MQKMDKINELVQKAINERSAQNDTQIWKCRLCKDIGQTDHDVSHAIY